MSKDFLSTPGPQAWPSSDAEREDPAASSSAPTFRRAPPEEARQAAPQDALQDTQPQPLRLERGAVVGDHVLLERVGAGGMGVVFSAYDTRLERKVAVKLLRPDAWGPVSSEQGRARLLREAQAMARLSHPHVVTVHAAGFAGTQPYVAMEFVEGQTLSAWLKERPRTWREVVDLFVQAGRGLAAAHEKGLVHRDFKPDNVLVGPDGRARVTDFGLVRTADATEVGAGTAQDGPAREGPPATLTQAGTLLGTPRFMAPEQHLRSPQVDARADQFAFCVALHEALFGAHPFHAESHEEMRERVLAGAVAEPSGGHRVPSRVRQVVLRGLSASPDARFPTMTELLAELERTTTQGGARALLAAAAALALVLAGAGGMQWYRAGAQVCSGAPAKLAGVWDGPVRERVRQALSASGVPHTAETLARVEAALDGYARDWAAMHTEACEATAVRKEQSAQLLDLRMHCLERRRSELRAVTTLLSGAQDAQLVDNAAKLVGGLESLRACADAAGLLAAFPLPQEPARREAVDALMARLDALKALHVAGRYDEGLQGAAEVLREARGLGHPPLTSRALLIQGMLETSASHFEAAERTLGEAVQAAAWAKNDADIVEAWNTLTWVLIRQGRFAEALALRPVTEAALARGTSDPEQRAKLYHNVGSIHFRMGKPRDAVEQFRQAVRILEEAPGPVSGRRALALTGPLANLGMVLGDTGASEEGKQFLERSLGLIEKELGPEHPRALVALSQLGTLAATQGKYAEALALHQRVLAAHERSVRPNSPERAIALHDVASELFALGRVQEAKDHQLRALAIWEEVHGPEHPDVALALSNLGHILHHEGRYAEAEQSHARALRIRLKAVGPTHPSVATSYGHRAEALVGLRRWAEAERSFESALSILEQGQRAGGELHVHVLLGLSELLLERGRAGAARPHVTRAVSICESSECEPLVSGRARFALARVLWPHGRERPRALGLARQALQDLQAAESAEAREERAALQAWLEARSGGARATASAPEP